MKHRVEFDQPPIDEFEYEDMASEFATKALESTMREEVRESDGATLRWDRSTNEFVVVTHDSFLASYMKLDPKWHGCPSNRTYFEAQQRSRR